MSDVVDREKNAKAEKIADELAGWVPNSVADILRRAMVLLASSASEQIDKANFHRLANHLSARVTIS
jgi:hypothetical protein